MRIVFMGTPDFAEASLKKLIDERFDVVGVFTQPDKPQNRGMKLVPPPVKVLAESAGIPVYQPEKMRTGEAMDILRQLQPDILAVVAYGKILPAEMLALPKYGAVNVHGSLLPKYRGAAPIQWAVLNGDETTGVSTMFLSEGMDEGDVIFSRETAIGEQETAGELFDRLAAMGAELLVETLRAIDAGTAPRTPQNHAEATYTKQLTKDLCPIDWTKSPREIVKHVCGLSPWPVATTELQGTFFKIHRVEIGAGTTHAAPGTVVAAGKDGISVACGNGGIVVIRELQVAGKKRMAAGDSSPPCRDGARTRRGRMRRSMPPSSAPGLTGATRPSPPACATARSKISLISISTAPRPCVGSSRRCSISCASARISSCFSRRFRRMPP